MKRATVTALLPFRQTHPVASLLSLRFVGVALLLHVGGSACHAGPTWVSSITKDPPGNFPELRPVRGHYHFGWSGITAAMADVHFTKLAGNRFQLEGTGRTIGLARVLWKLDATY